MLIQSAYEFKKKDNSNVYGRFDETLSSETNEHTTFAENSSYQSNLWEITMIIQFCSILRITH